MCIIMEDSIDVWMKKQQMGREIQAQEAERAKKAKEEKEARERKIREQKADDNMSELIREIEEEEAKAAEAEEARQAKKASKREQRKNNTPVQFWELPFPVSAPASALTSDLASDLASAPASDLASTSTATLASAPASALASASTFAPVQPVILSDVHLVLPPNATFPTNTIQQNLGLTKCHYYDSMGVARPLKIIPIYDVSPITDLTEPLGVVYGSRLLYHPYLSSQTYDASSDLDMYILHPTFLHFPSDMTFVEDRYSGDFILNSVSSSDAAILKVKGAQDGASVNNYRVPFQPKQRIQIEHPDIDGPEHPLKMCWKAIR